MKNRAQGFAFNAKELMANMNMKRLKLKGKDCLPYTHDQHKDEFSANVFLTHFFLVIHDIIENNVTYHILSRTKLRAVLKTRVIKGYKFQKLFQQGVFKGLDPMKSYFSGAEIILHIHWNRKPFVQTVFINDILNKKIIKNLNNGMQYGDGKNETTWRDYMDQIYEKYNTISKLDLNYIVTTGWVNLLQLKVRGADIKLLQRPYAIYIGKLFKDSLRHFKYYKEKLLQKMIFLNRVKKKIKLDNKWYFYVYRKMHENIQNGKGDILTGYRTKDMASLGKLNGSYIYTMPCEENEKKYVINVYPEDCNKVTYVGKRKLTTFKYIQDNLKKFKV